MNLTPRRRLLQAIVPQRAEAMERDVYFAEVKECMSALRSFVGIAISDELSKTMQMQDIKIINNNNSVSNMPGQKMLSAVVTPDSQVQTSTVDKISISINRSIEGVKNKGLDMDEYVIY